MSADLTKLRALAEAAASGPWEASTSEATMNDRSAYRFGPWNKPMVFRADQMRAADAAYIAAANPDVVLDLIARIEAVEKLHAPEEDCSNSRHTNTEVSCPDCYEYCLACGEMYPCPTIRALRGEA